MDAGANRELSVAFVPSDANNYEPATATTSLSVLRAPQHIDFDPLVDVLVNGAPVQLHATASSGLEVSFTLISGPAVLLDGELTLTGPGRVLVQAAQGGNDNFEPAASVERAFEVTILVPNLTIRQAASGEGATLVISGSAGLPVTVLMSTDLLGWTAVHTTTLGTAASEWTDPESVQAPMRFYRVVVLPMP